MKCAEHIEVSAVGTCNSCGKGLCPDCVSIFTPPLCTGCALAHNKGISKSFGVQLALMGALFVVALVILFDKVPLLTALWYSVMAAFFLPGWNFLGRYFSPSGGYLFPMARWINLLFHAGTALLIGVIVGPIYLFKAWKELQVVHETKKTFGNQ